MNKIDELMTAAYNMGRNKFSRDEFDAYCDYMNVTDSLYFDMLQQFEKALENN